MGKCSRLWGIVLVVVAAAVFCCPVRANWYETFGGNAYDLPGWQYLMYPKIANTFGGIITDGPNDNDYLRLYEPTSLAAGGCAFGIGFPSSEDFTDVRLGATVNIEGDTSQIYFGLGARSSYFQDPDGSLSGAPGTVASAYAMLFLFQDGPENLRIEIVKIYNLDQSDVHKVDFEKPVPGAKNARSYYGELEVVGSGPVYITGRLYEYKDGPLVATTDTVVDTDAQDWWEDPGPHIGVYKHGPSGIFGVNEEATPAGHLTTWDDISSVSDGPTAVNTGPANGATGVSIGAKLTWVEAQFAVGRQLWFGEQGNMQMVSTAASPFDPGLLMPGKTYNWRVDELGAGATVVKGHEWTFTTGDCIMIDDFESYADDAAIDAAWPDNINGWNYVFAETASDKVHDGAKSLRFEYSNQADPWYTTATTTFSVAQDWASTGASTLTLSFLGTSDNLDQPFAVELEDAAGGKFRVDYGAEYAVRTRFWTDWSIPLQQFADGGVNLSAVKKISLVTGDGTPSGQPSQDRDTLYIDSIRLCPSKCKAGDGVDLRGDINGDCSVNFTDFAMLVNGWMSEGAMEP